MFPGALLLWLAGRGKASRVCWGLWAGSPQHVCWAWVSAKPWIPDLGIAGDKEGEAGSSLGPSGGSKTDPQG